jgi:hypothetical protein
MKDIMLSSDDYEYKFSIYDSAHWAFDTISHAVTFQWDSLNDDEYIFSFQTVFSKKQILKFNLDRNSAFHMKNELGLNYTELIDKADLLNSDSIEFVYRSSGCFCDYYENSTLLREFSDSFYFIKNNSNLIMKPGEPTYYEKKVTHLIIDSIYALEIRSKKLSEVNYNFLHISTTTNYFYLLADSRYFKFSDRGIDNWDLYMKFKKKFIE